MGDLEKGELGVGGWGPWCFKVGRDALTPPPRVVDREPEQPTLP